MKLIPECVFPVIVESNTYALWAHTVYLLIHMSACRKSVLSGEASPVLVSKKFLTDTQGIGLSL